MQTKKNQHCLIGVESLLETYLKKGKVQMDTKCKPKGKYSLYSMFLLLPLVRLQLVNLIFHA